MIKKLFYFILAVSISGFGIFIWPDNIGNVPQSLKLKAPKEKILAHREVKVKRQVPLFGGNASSSQTITETIVSYDYVTNVETKDKVIFNNGETFSNFKLASENGNQRTWHFYSGDHFYKDGNKVFEIEHGATTTPEAFAQQTKLTLIEKIRNSFTALAVDYYAGAGDGSVEGYDGSLNWATIRGLATGSGANYTATEGPGCYARKVGSSYIAIKRSFFPIDTSGIPDTDTITAATFHVKTSYLATPMGKDLVQTSQASTAQLTTADYQAFSYTTGATRVSFGTDGTFNSFTLNATGLSWISKTGVTKLGVLSALDTDNTAPTNDNDDTNLFYSESTGTASDPYLAVTSGAASTGWEFYDVN